MLQCRAWTCYLAIQNSDRCLFETAFSYLLFVKVITRYHQFSPPPTSTMSSSPPGFTKYGRHSLRYPDSLRPATTVAPPGAVINLAKPPLSIQNRGRKSARMHKRLAGLFKRSKETDNGGIRLHPAFMDDYMDRRPSSPDSSFRGRSSSGSGKSMFKIFPAKRSNGRELMVSRDHFHKQ